MYMKKALKPSTAHTATNVKKFQVVVYDDFSGSPLQVTFLSGRWWVTTPGVELQPLKDYFGDEHINFIYLCEAGGTVGALALARMLGKTLENPEDQVDACLRNRVAELKRLGVTLDLKDETLVLELEVFSNEQVPVRQGNYSVKCHLAGDIYQELFDIDGFETKQHAEEWAGYLFDFLDELNVRHIII